MSKRFPLPPQVDWQGTWTELRGYVQEAISDGGTIKAAEFAAYMDELKRTAFAPFRAWMERVQATPESDLPSLGQIGYEAYGDAVQWKNHQGNPMPEWDALPDVIRLAWHACVNAVVVTALEDQPHPGGES